MTCQLNMVSWSTSAASLISQHNGKFHALVVTLGSQILWHNPSTITASFFFSWLSVLTWINSRRPQPLFLHLDSRRHSRFLGAANICIRLQTRCSERDCIVKCRLASSGRAAARKRVAAGHNVSRRSSATTHPSTQPRQLIGGWRQMVVSKTDCQMPH